MQNKNIDMYKKVSLVCDEFGLTVENLDSLPMHSMIQQLQKGFTTQRDDLEGLYRDKNSLLAYCLYYHLTNPEAYEHAMQGLCWPVFEQITEFGPGPGTFSRELCDKFFAPQVPEKKYFAIERVQTFLSLTQKIVGKPFRKGPAPQHSGGLLFFTSSFNEISLEEFEALEQNLRPKAIGLLEPGTKENFKKIQQLRSKLIKKGYKVIFPCMRQSECPSDWCHQKFDMSYQYEGLLKKWHLERKSRSMIFHFYVLEDFYLQQKELSPSYFGQSSHDARIVQAYKALKFKRDFEVCSKDYFGIYSMAFRGLKKSQIKEIKSLRSGQALTIRNLNPS